MNDSSPDAIPRPLLPPQASWSWMIRHPSRILAFGFGSGLLKPAPGTWGTLYAWWLWNVFDLRDWSASVLLGFLLLAFLVGCWACDRAGRSLGVLDHGGMVWDEMVAFWLVLALVPDGLFSQAFAFLIFRLFDITKPPPIRHMERRFKGGFGVMWDDLIAAFYTVLVFALAFRLGVLA